MANADQLAALRAEVDRLRRRVAELEASIAAAPDDASAALPSTPWPIQDLLTPAQVGAADEPDVVGYATAFAPGQPAAVPARTLQAIAERYALLAHGTAAGIWDLDLQRGCGYLSPRWKELVGYHGDDALAGQQAFAARLHPDDQPRYLAAQRDHLEGRLPFNLEVRLRDDRGEYRWLHAVGQAQWDAAGRPVRLVGSICDVTLRQRLEEALRERQRVEGRLEGVTYTAREMADCLNNELTVVGGALELVQEQGGLPPALEALVAAAGEQLVAAARHLVQLQQVVRVATKETPVGPALDLERSVQPEPPAEG